MYHDLRLAWVMRSVQDNRGRLSYRKNEQQGVWLFLDLCMLGLHNPLRRRGKPGAGVSDGLRRQTRGVVKNWQL